MASDNNDNNRDTLDLTALVERRIRVKGHRGYFDLLRASDLDSIVAHRLNALADDYNARVALGTVTEDTLRAAADNLRLQIRTLSPLDPPFHLTGHFEGIPDDDLQRLSVQELILILDFFIDRTGLLRGEASTEFRDAVNKLNQLRTGALSSPSYKPFTTPETR